MAGGDYSIDFSSADPNLYPRLLPSQISTLPSGRASDPLTDAADDTSVESLAPDNLALGQIVPFEFRISVDDSAPNGDSITFTAGWETVTTNGGGFGYDGDLGVIAAFVDAADPSAANDTDATVGDFSWTVVGTEIQGTIEVDNLDPGEEIVVEVWVVLQETFPSGTGGNVQSRLIDAETSGTVDPGDTINTGNQTVPLLRVRNFDDSDADLSVIKSDNGDDPVVITDGDDPQQVEVGDQFTYTIEVTNNSTDTVSNEVLVTDTLDANVAFVSATVAEDSEGFITPDSNIVHDGSARGGTVTADLEFLNPGETVTLEVTVEVLDTAPTGGTEDLINTVTVDALTDDPDESNNTDEEPTDVVATLTPSLTVTKTVSSITNPDLSDGGTTVDEAGDVINYTIEVENTGDQDLTGVTVNDPLLGGDLGDPDSGDINNDGVLDVGETWIYNESYTVTQEDIDSNGIDADGNPDGDGDIDNTVTADSDQTDPVTDDADVPLIVGPVLSLIKEGEYTDADGNGELNPGDTLDYTFTVTNDGNVTVTGVSINEESFDLPGPITITPPADVDLSPGESAEFTGQYVLTQADIDAIFQQADGDVDNVATAEGDDPNGDPVVSPPDDAEIPLDPAAEIDIDKTATLTNDADGDGEVSLGDTITYTYTVKNEGEVTLDNLAVSDDILGPIDLGAEDDSNGDGVTVLAPGATEIGTATAVVTQADVDAGQIVNLGTVTADDPNDDPVTDDDPEVVPVGQDIMLSLVKEGVYTDADGNGEINPGDTLDYTFTVTNDGNVTVTGVSINEQSFDLPGDITIIPPADVDLSPGESAEFTGQYVLTQADIDAIFQQADGDVDNVATATGTDPDGDPVVSDPDDAEIPFTLDAPELTITKTVTGIDTAGNGILDAAGDIIDYDLVVTNEGQVTLTNVVVTDPLTGVNTNIGDLAPDATETISTSYTITQEDLDSNGTLEPDNLLAGQIDNTATADSDQTDPVEDDADVPLIVESELEVTKTADVSSVDEAGDVINYTIEVENTGNTSLTNVTVNDPLLGGDLGEPDSGDIDNDGVLDVGETWVYNESYTVTQDDIDSNGGGDGDIDNTVIVDSDQTPPEEDSEDVPIITPGLNVTKTADVSSVDEAGDVINYTIEVENTGNTSLTNVTVNDPLLGGDLGEPDSGDIDNDGVLDVGETWVYNESYTVTQDDIDSNGGGDGDIDNTVTADSDQTDPDSDDEEVDIVEPANPDIDIEKFTNGHNADILDVAAEVAAGETVTWTYEVTNTGNVSFNFDEIEVTDDQGVIPVLDFSTDVGSDNVLSPGETWTYVGSEAAQDLNEVIDFEQFDAGDQGNTINAGLSGVTISTDWVNGLMIFDSANITGDPDDDLGTPNADFGGPGNGFGGEASTPGENSIPQSEVLILSQDGDPTDPNDAREGGTITFDWETPVRINQIGVLDIDTYEDGSTVTTFDISGNVIDTYDLQTLGDNSFQIVSMDDINVSRMEVFFSGSAAITEVDFDNFYQNIGTVTIDDITDSDSSSYFNPFEGPKDPEPQGDTGTEPTPQPNGSIHYEAENLHLDGYRVENASFASDGGLVALSDSQGSVSTTFNGADGTYEFTLAAFDENDGESPIEVVVNGEVVQAFTLDQNLKGTRASADNLVEFNFNIDLEQGDEIEIRGSIEDGERARLDFFKLTPVTGDDSVQPPVIPSDGTQAVQFIQAEDLLLHNYKVESKSFASGSQLVALNDQQGSASTTFDGPAGNYSLEVNAFDEIDGESTLTVFVNGVEMGQAVLDQRLGGTRASSKNLVTQSFDLALEPGDEIEIQGTREAGERARFDSIAIVPESVNFINSTAQDELLSGGLGQDIFNFTTPSGDDIVKHFEQGVDQLLLNIDGVDSFDDLDITSSGSHTVVSFPEQSDSITLEGVNSLTADDVLFGNYNTL